MESAQSDRVRQTPTCGAVKGKKGTRRCRMYYICVLQQQDQLRLPSSL